MTEETQAESEDPNPRKCSKSVLRLAHFDDFRDCAKGCRHVFYVKQQVNEGVRVTAYAGRVCWSRTYADPEAGESVLEELRSLGWKRILGDFPREQVLEYLDFDWFDSEIDF